MAQMNAFCPVCRKNVMAMTMLKDDEVVTALQSKMDVGIMHTSRFPDGTSGDHTWSLDENGRENLRKYLGKR
jgi:hypothetical protein